MILKHMFDCDKMESKKRPFITKADIVLLSVVLTVALVLLFVFYVNRKPGSYASLSFDGSTVMQIPLSQTEPQYYLVLWNDSQGGAPASLENMTIQTLSREKWSEESEALTADSGVSAYNLFSCENGEIRMIQSSCPDLICVHHAAVSRTGENIICLPHALVIEIVGAQENELDGVVY